MRRQRRWTAAGDGQGRMESVDGHSAHQAKFFAHALTRAGGSGVSRIQQSLLNAAVDLNPHQVEAVLFALRSPR